MRLISVWNLTTPTYHCSEDVRRARYVLSYVMLYDRKIPQQNNKNGSVNSVKDCLKGSFPENTNPFYISSPLEKMGL